jgi:hypothetical protein
MVTLHSKDDLDSFYDDMQTPGGDLYIPDRAVTLNNQRPVSRTTEYWLTDVEAELVKNDPRVKVVELNPKDRNIRADHFDIIEQTGNFDRDSSSASTDLNWGLYRLARGSNVANWGSSFTSLNDTIKLNATGRNVDCIICDGNGVYTGHPEYTQPSGQDTNDGSATRLNLFDWNTLQTQVGAPDSYTYSNPGSYHANHVMGTVGGNRQGWARNANLYNLYYYAGDINNNNFPYVFDYIRVFHENKAVNPSTGYKNPTVVNNSWGMSIFPAQWSFSAIDAVTYRGTRFTPDGDIVYQGANGVYSSTELLSSFTDNPDNGLGQRIVTSGSEGAINGDFTAVPTGWTRSGGNVSETLTTVPDATYTVRIQGPTEINFRHNVSSGGITGTTTIQGTVTVQDESAITINSITDTQTSTDGGTAEIDLIRLNLSLPNNEIYSVTYSTSVTLGTDPTTAALMSCTIVGYSAANPQATITSLGTQTIGDTTNMTASVTPTTGNNDDGYWQISLPFSITYLSESHNTIFMGTNSYLTFGGGSSSYSGIDINTPAFPKIMVGGGDRSCQRIFYGTTGVSGNRIFTLIYEGHTTYQGGVLGSPTIRYEYKFYEATPTQIDLVIELNNAKSSSGSFTNAQLNGWGFISGQRIPLRVSALDADIEDAIDAGIITIGAAGNGQWKHDIPGGPDWDNTFEMNGVTYYYMRGTSPTANDNLVDGDYDIPNICVGATDVGLTIGLDRKVSFSDCGPGVDIYAPGTSIQSAHNSGTTTDPRNPAYRLSKISGTSMASPQVAGLVACMMETYPHWKQEDVKEYLVSKWAEEGQLYDATATDIPTDTDDLQGSPNKHAKYHYERPLEGAVYPKKDYAMRPTSGIMYPRVKRTVIKRQPE